MAKQKFLQRALINYSTNVVLNPPLRRIHASHGQWPGKKAMQKLGSLL
jgi:hypothetical protein